MRSDKRKLPRYFSERLSRFGIDLVTVILVIRNYLSSAMTRALIIRSFRYFLVISFYCFFFLAPDSFGRGWDCIEAIREDNGERHLPDLNLNISKYSFLMTVCSY